MFIPISPLVQYAKFHAAAVTIACSIDENLRTIFFDFVAARHSN
jgi:hypothetical protein